MIATPCHALSKIRFCQLMTGLSETLVKYHPLKGVWWYLDKWWFRPYPIVRRFLITDKAHRLSPQFSNFPSLPTKKEKMSSIASDSDIIRIADSDLFSWPADATRKLKRSVNRGYAKFCKRRYGFVPKEEFQPSKFLRRPE